MTIQVKETTEVERENGARIVYHAGLTYVVDETTGFYLLMNGKATEVESMTVAAPEPAPHFALSPPPEPEPEAAPETDPETLEEVE